MMKLGIVGATGAVGQRMLQILATRWRQPLELKLFASPRSTGRQIDFRDQVLTCQPLESGCFSGLDWLFFDASDEVSLQWVPQALAAGVRVVDHSGTFRMKTDVPLVVPEINGDQAIEAYRSGQKLFAGPNCSTVQLVMALAPLHAAYGIRRVVASTYQSVSGAGREAVSEFFGQIAQGVDAYPPRHLAHPIAQNLIPQIGKFGSDGFSSEETKIMQESRKILGLPDLRIVATAVRVPTEVVHCESVAIEFDRACTIEGVRQALSDFPGIAVQDDPALGIYPMNLTSRDQDLVAVGRIRRDPSVDSGVTLWIASDNLRKGAALNAIQIAELLISQGSG